jgi:hypothetical protein
MADQVAAVSMVPTAALAPTARVMLAELKAAAAEEPAQPVVISAVPEERGEGVTSGALR